MKPALITRFITAIGKRCELVTEWEEPKNPCSSDKYGATHRSEIVVPEAMADKWRSSDFELDRQITVQCNHCQSLLPTAGKKDQWMRTMTLYDTPTGAAAPGDVYWEIHEPGHCFYRWNNCDGRHLMVILPNGRYWDVMSRASNCTMPEDHDHRCWVCHERSPGIFHVDKSGLTCQAGAGSIMMDDYHGFLHNGELTSC